MLQSFLFQQEGWTAKVRILNGVIIFFPGRECKTVLSPLMAGRLSRMDNHNQKKELFRKKDTKGIFGTQNLGENDKKWRAKGIKSWIFYDHINLGIELHCLSFLWWSIPLN